MKTASLFTNGRSQAVRLPAEFAFEGVERVYVRRDANGDVVLSAKPRDFSRFIAMVKEAPGEPIEFERDRRPHDRDPLAGCTE